MIVWLHVGQDVHFVGGNINEAVNEGVRKGYTENYLRASSVDDPLYDRKNTKDNIVKLIGSDVLPDDQKLTLEIARVIRLGFLPAECLPSRRYLRSNGKTV